VPAIRSDLDMNSPQVRYKWITVLCVFGTLSLGRVFSQSSTNVTLAWNPSPAPGIVAYNVYSGVASQNYTNMFAVGNVTNTLVSGLASGTTYYFSVTAVDTAGLESQFSNETSFSVPSNAPPVISNTAPVISSIANQTINVSTSTGPLAFMIGDAETPAANLPVSASSSNPALVPAGNITLAGSGTVWTITVAPAAGQTGTATIAVTVCDPALCTTTNFSVAVIPLPTVALTSPANGASYTNPATVNFAANVTANGHSITAVQFFNGTTLLGQASTTPYTLVWTNVGAGSYSLTAHAVYDAGNAVSSSTATISVSAAPILPLPWLTANIGSIGISGNVTSSNGTFTVQGAGNIGGSGDNFRFLYQNLSGDGEIRAQIYSAQNTGSGDLTGAMVRESLTSGSKYALMGLSPGGPMRWQRRSSTGSGTMSSKYGNASPPNVWVRVVRTGNTLSGYKSVDGINWTLVNSANIAMASNIYIGLAEASGSASTLATSLFTNVMVVP
jgi:hypothetical protein